MLLFITVDHEQMTSRRVYFACVKTGQRHAYERRKFINICFITGTIISSAKFSFVLQYTQKWYWRIYDRGEFNLLFLFEFYL